MQVKELGHVVLYVRDLERSRRFYRDVLGWREIPAPASRNRQVALFSSGRTHHELLLIEVGADAAPIPEGRRVGLYHFGLKIGESDDELREAQTACQSAGVPIMGASDHGVSHSLYILDPDGNEVELYIDVQPPVWKDDPQAVLAPTRPLRSAGVGCSRSRSRPWSFRRVTRIGVC
jgi:catechol 2,3-dioxygenase